MISTFTTISLLTALATAAGAPPSSPSGFGPVAGHWEGVLVREGSELPVSFDFQETAGLQATFDSPTQRALGIPLRNVVYSPPSVHAELVGDATTIVFDGVLENEALAGQFREGTTRGTFSLRRVQAPPPTYSQEEVTFRNGGVSLAGTLLLPLSAGPHPAVVFLQGSGPEGRSGGRFLAAFVTRYHIAALIYDKRGVGGSTGDWRRSNFRDLAGDTLAGVHYLQTRREINPKRIGVYGHSQGGMIAPLVASLSPDVAFVISGAGSAVPVYVSEINSITNQVRAKGITGQELADAEKFIELWVQVTRTGLGTEQLDLALDKARDAKWLPMLHVPPEGDWRWAFYRGIYDYDSAEYWPRVTVPVLVLYGERDLYVPVQTSVANIERALNKGGNRDYTILVLPRASHAFDLAPDAGQPFEWPHVAAGLPDLIAAWINHRMK